MEQLLSRFSYRVQLLGMTEKEILTLGARGFGNGKPAKLSEKHQKALLDNCKVEDPYFIGSDGKPTLRTYYSSRRLVEFVSRHGFGVFAWYRIVVGAIALIALALIA